MNTNKIPSRHFLYQARVMWGVVAAVLAPNARARPGSEVELRIVRDGRKKKVTVKLGELSAGRLARPKGPSGFRRDDNHEPLNGITVHDLDYRTRWQFGIPNDITGRIVVDADRSSAAASAWLCTFDAIVEHNRHRVDVAVGHS